MNEDKRLWHEKRSKDEIELEIETNPEEAAFNLYEDILCMKAADGWISLEDQLPKDNQDCLARCDDKILPVTYYQNYWESSHLLFPGACIPTHWQPLPPLPTK